LPDFGEGFRESEMLHKKIPVCAGQTQIILSKIIGEKDEIVAKGNRFSQLGW